MAEIYLATRTGASGFSKTCVLKRVKPRFREDPKFREMLEREAKVAADLEHSNIVQILDLIQHDDGELYVAMQYVDGCSLEELRRHVRGQLLPPFLAARIARDVAGALAYAWEAPGPDGQPLHVVHRDISPHNVLLSRSGEVKLADFGIARPLSSDTTGGFKGKIAYMAPEQARGAGVDQRTDVFGLAVTLFELVTGQRPFDAPSDIAFVHEMAMGTVPAPAANRLNPLCPDSLVAALARALERDPARRTGSALQFGRELEEVLRGAQSSLEFDVGRFLSEVGMPLSATPTAARIAAATTPLAEVPAAVAADAAPEPTRRERTPAGDRNPALEPDLRKTQPLTAIRDSDRLRIEAELAASSQSTAPDRPAVTAKAGLEPALPFPTARPDAATDIPPPPAAAPLAAVKLPPAGVAPARPRDLSMEPTDPERNPRGAGSDADEPRLEEAGRGWLPWAAVVLVAALAGFGMSWGRHRQVAPVAAVEPPAPVVSADRVPADAGPIDAGEPDAGAPSVLDAGLAAVPAAPGGGPVPEEAPADGGVVVDAGSRSVSPEPTKRGAVRIPGGPPGVLEARATPFAVVYVDGKQVGETPLRADIPSGKHTVLFEYLGQRFRQPVVIDPGGVTRVEFNFPIR